MGCQVRVCLLYAGTDTGLILPIARHRSSASLFFCGAVPTSLRQETGVWPHPAVHVKWMWSTWRGSAAKRHGSVPYGAMNPEQRNPRWHRSCESDAWPFCAEPFLFEARRAVGQAVRTTLDFLPDDAVASGALKYIAVAKAIEE